MKSLLAHGQALCCIQTRTLHMLQHKTTIQREFKSPHLLDPPVFCFFSCVSGEPLFSLLLQSPACLASLPSLTRSREPKAFHRHQHSNCHPQLPRRPHPTPFILFSEPVRKSANKSFTYPLSNTFVSEKDFAQFCVEERKEKRKRARDLGASALCCRSP